jgi:hypothetical protein
MKKLKTNKKGFYSLVDDNLFDELNKFHWTLRCSNKKYYVHRCVYDKKTKKGKDISLHHSILKPPKGFVIDHIDNNGLNNQINNLRICTHSQNMMNRRMNITNKTGYKGVIIIKNLKRKFRAQIGLNGKRKRIGDYLTAEEAGRAYDVEAKKMFGEFANLNFKK